jgi:hypothetical protein
MAVEACAADDACTTLDARTIHTDVEPNCVDFSEESVPKACMDADVGCGDAETLAGPPDSDECWWFPSTCVPDGWTSCGDVAHECS